MSSHEDWLRGAEVRQTRHAEQTRRRIRRKQLRLETRRLLRLGADPEWVARVTGREVP
jgi:hypothetical protein